MAKFDRAVRVELASSNPDAALAPRPRPAASQYISALPTGGNASSGAWQLPLAWRGSQLDANWSLPLRPFPAHPLRIARPQDQPSSSSRWGDPLFPPRSPLELDRAVTEWAARCGGVNTCDLSPLTTRWRYFAMYQLEQQAARMYPVFQSLTHSNALLNEVLGYAGYDVYVEALDQVLDFSRAALGAGVAAPPHPVGGGGGGGGGAASAYSASLLANGAALRVRGATGALLSYRLRGAYALLKTTQLGEQEPYHLDCLGQIAVDVNFPAAGVANPAASGAVSYLDIACAQGATCQRCLQVYHLAGLGGAQQHALWGAYGGCMPERVALAELILRAWLCEEREKARLGVGAYWARRHAALAADQLHLRHRRFLHDVASATVSGALGTCADLGLDEAMGNVMGDDFDTAGSRALGTHCVLTHDMLWPHKARLLQLASHHLAAAGHAPPGSEGCELERVSSRVLRAAVLELADEVRAGLDQGGVGGFVGASGGGVVGHLDGLQCANHAVDTNDYRFSMLHKYPRPDGGCGRRMPGIGGTQQIAASQFDASRLDPGLTGARSSLRVFLTWLLRKLRAVPAIAQSGVLDGFEAAWRVWAQRSAGDKLEGDTNGEWMHREGEAPNQAGALVKMYFAANDARRAAAQREREREGGADGGERPRPLVVDSPCPSAASVTCGAMHGVGGVRLSEVLGEAVMPAIVRVWSVWMCNFIDWLLYITEQQFDEWKELSEQRSAEPLQCNLKHWGHVLCDKVSDCAAALRAELLAVKWVLPELVYHPKIRLSMWERAALRWGCATECAMRAVADQMQFLGVHNLYLVLHAMIKGAAPMALHHKRRLKAHPHTLAVRLFNRYVGTYNPTAREVRSFNKAKIDVFLRERTASLPYNVELRKAEEDYVQFEVMRSKLLVQASLYNGLRHGGRLVMQRQGCICSNDAEAIALGEQAWEVRYGEAWRGHEDDTDGGISLRASDPGDPADTVQGDALKGVPWEAMSVAEQNQRVHRLELQTFPHWAQRGPDGSCDTALKPKSNAGYRPSCADGTFGCITPAAIERIAGSVGVQMVPFVVREELEGAAAEELLAKIYQSTAKISEDDLAYIHGAVD